LGERMLAVVFVKRGRTGRTFRTPSAKDISAWNATAKITAGIDHHLFGELSNTPDEPLPYLRSIFNVHVYGVTRWSQLFNTRQLLAAITFAKLVRRLCNELLEKRHEDDFASAVVTMLALAVDRQINALNRTCYWNPSGPKMQAGFARQAIPMFWDYCEANPFGGSVGSWESMVKCVSASFEAIDKPPGTGNSASASATQHPLPNDSADSIITDPPYYDAVPYADLSDFFYVWLKRMLWNVYPGLFEDQLSPKKLEVVQLAERNPAYAYKTKDNFENLMMMSLAEARRVAKPHSASVIVFAHQSTAGWEAMLTALINAGWIVTASWPIDTEMPTRVRAQNSAVLASSVHLLCRPRENADGSIRTDEIGDWRDVLQELPRRIHEWMPRLAEEGVVGADAIFACLGPALEIFSRYSRVEKASGEAVTLKEYLEQVWAAVAKEALVLVFKDADTTGFEADARLTAMWLWTLNAANGADGNGELADQESEEESEGSAKKPKVTGFILEYDAARKIAQGLGANLEHLDSLVEIKGDVARLLPVAERARSLFGKDEGKIATKRRNKEPQMDLFKVLETTDEDRESANGMRVSRVGDTVLDRIHQSMILFAAGRGEALKRFLVEDGAGRDQRFWKLSQALSALYPTSTEEKRWIDGVLARKKGLGF
jgi:putative DNA methylase